MKKTIKDFDLENKKVIIRVDFNVPIIDGIIMDDNRIKESLKTIKYAVNKKAKVILMSHLGRVKNNEDKIENNLNIVAIRLQELLNKKVIFVNETRGPILEEAISKLKPKQILLMQNTRYEDLNGELESNNDSSLGKYWASLGDIYINDAFGTSHRSHASNVGIASNLPSGIGFLIEKELKELKSTIDNPKRPFVVILGGSKVNDKVGVIENLAQKADYILIGGGMGYTFLRAGGILVGKSKVDTDSLEFCKNILEKYKDKIVLPIDSVNAKTISEDAISRESFIGEIEADEIGLDIGYNTVKLFRHCLENAATVVWNGPLGVTEIEQFSKGTKRICEVLKKLDAKKIIGGGDTGSAIINFGYSEVFDHISTGGGASLELLEGKKLSGIEIIGEK